MIVTTIIDPNVFDNSYSQEMNLDYLKDFLYRIKTENIIILIDSFNQLTTQYIKFLKNAKNKMVHIRIIFEEILKVAKSKLNKAPIQRS